MLKHGYYIQALYIENSRLHRVQGRGKILALFMHRVYINSLLKELSDHCFAIFINTLRMPAPPFADDICLTALHQSLLKILMNKCHNYSKTWIYKFNNSKSGVVTSGESNPYIANQ